MYIIMDNAIGAVVLFFLTVCLFGMPFACPNCDHKPFDTLIGMRVHQARKGYCSMSKGMMGAAKGARCSPGEDVADFDGGCSVEDNDS